MDSPGGRYPVQLTCHLHCQVDNTTEVRTLLFPSLPTLVMDLKEKVGEEFSIPYCIQTLSYNSEVLPDTTLISMTRMRSGDTVDIHYPARGDCQEVEEVNSWLRSLALAYTDYELSEDEIDQIVHDGLRSGLDSALGYNLFEWLIPRTMVNKIYFEDSGGLSLLFRVYQIIFQREWSDMHIHQRYLESVCTQAFANFGETAALRRILVQMGVLELCFKAQLRVLVPKNGCVEDLESVHGDKEISDGILRTELDNALHLLCWYTPIFPPPSFSLFSSALYPSVFTFLPHVLTFLPTASALPHSFSELPECQLKIASQGDVLKQIINIALSPSYPCPTTSLTSEVLLCLAHTRDTHHYLTDDYVISGMLQALRDRPSMVEQTAAGALQIVGLR